LLDWIKPTRGQASIFGLDCQSKSPRLKRDIGYVPSAVNYYPTLTTQQTLEYVGKLRQIENLAARISELFERLDINPNQRMGDLSLGNKKKAAIAQALLGRPRLLIMDEPTNGLDPLLQNRLEELLLEEHQRGTTVFLSSHNLQEVQRLCNRVAIIKEGTILEVQDLSRMLDRAVRRVRVAGEGLSVDSLKKLNPQQLEELDRGFSFNYQGDTSHLLQILAALNLNDVAISEPALEDIFIKYYAAERKG